MPHVNTTHSHCWKLNSKPMLRNGWGTDPSSPPKKMKFIFFQFILCEHFCQEWLLIVWNLCISDILKETSNQTNTREGENWTELDKLLQYLFVLTHVKRIIPMQSLMLVSFPRENQIQCRCNVPQDRKFRVRLIYFEYVQRQCVQWVDMFKETNPRFFDTYWHRQEMNPRYWGKF